MALLVTQRWFLAHLGVSLQKKAITGTPVTTALPPRHSNSHMRRNQETKIYFSLGPFQANTTIDTQPRTHTRGKEERGKEPTLFFSSEVSPFNAGEELKKAAARGGGGGEGGGEGGEEEGEVFGCLELLEEGEEEDGGGLDAGRQLTCTCRTRVQYT